MLYYLCYLLQLWYSPDIWCYLGYIYSVGGIHFFNFTIAVLFWVVIVIFIKFIYLFFVVVRNYFEGVFSKRVSNFYIVSTDYFAKRIIFLKMLVY